MRLKVYYLDDEADLCENFSDAFSSQEIIIETFQDPDAFLKRVIAAKPDLVFLDFRLPNKSGNEIAECLPEDLPKVLVTGDINVAASSKFMAVFEKPVMAEKIFKLIRSILSNKKQ